MLAEELGLRNFLNINVVCTRKLAQSITCLSLPGYYLVCTKTGQEPNGIKLVVTYYHIKGYGSACRMHPRVVETGPC